MSSLQLKESFLQPFRQPLLLIWALAFTGIFYLVNRQANLYDIANPRWVITMATLILVSPFFNGGFILLLQARRNGEKLSLGQAIVQTFSNYGSLIVGELLVNMIVVAGGILFVIPGIYFGLRLIFYKQEILIGGARGTAALKMSVARTQKWRGTLSLFASLSLFYLPAVAVFFVPMSLAWDLYALLASALTFAWINILLTRIYLDAKEGSKQSPMHEGGTN
ncbi:MAG TPA: hypothetical protein ENH11_06760 [Candidatus Acetothermia bacterium]|nr:hypothetical protein [Candidatus Acetothermia bacterium]